MLKENRNNNASGCIKLLWEEGFFKESRTLKEVSEFITEKWGNNFTSPNIGMALGRVKFLTCLGKRGSFQYKQKISSKSKRVENIEEQLFSDDLINKFGHPFEIEIRDLHLNFGISGNCTSFLLRKILEKLIIIVFGKNGLSSKLEDKSKMGGRLLGLEAMIDVAASEKIGGISFILPKTANHIKGIKFLGDTANHNCLTNVDMETILPQMPFIITAYKELSERL